MKILANKDIRNLFLAVSVIWAASLLLAQGFLWLRYQRLSLCLLLIFLLAAAAIWVVCCSYFKKQNKIMEQAVSQINVYLDGDSNARIECDSEGELYRLFHSVNSLAAVLNAHADNELREKEFLKNLPVEKLWGIGNVTAQSLRSRGITTIGQLSQLHEAQLKSFFGQHAGTIHNLSLGKDDRAVVSEREAKSIGAEETFEVDLRDIDEMRTILMSLAERVGSRLRQEKTAGKTITLKLRYGTFQTLTRRRTLAEPTQIDDTIYRIAGELLEQQDIRTGVRLLGVTVSQLEPERPVESSLFENKEEKGRQLSSAMDRMRLKFGPEVLMHGRLAPRKEGKDMKS